MKRPLIVLGLFVFLVGFLVFPQVLKAQDSTVMWINHLNFLPGDPSVVTSFNASTVPPTIDTGSTGLVITSTTTAGSKVVEKGVQVPPWYLVTGVRICYELTSMQSYISQVALVQLQTPGVVTPVLIDGTDRTSTDPVCVDTIAALNPINQVYGALRLSLGLNFGSTTDAIVLRGVGLRLIPDPNSPIQKEIDALWEAFENHTHIYLTGKGVGHNNTEAMTSEPSVPGSPEPIPPEPPCKNKKKCK
jgi:hypothetical protein